jgi:hypothetical protein
MIDTRFVYIACAWHDLLAENKNKLMSKLELWIQGGNQSLEGWLVNQRQWTS